jgi:hypothetical protein
MEMTLRVPQIIIRWPIREIPLQESGTAYKKEAAAEISLTWNKKETNITERHANINRTTSLLLSAKEL